VDAFSLTLRGFLPGFFPLLNKNKQKLWSPFIDTSFEFLNYILNIWLDQACLQTSIDYLASFFRIHSSSSEYSMLRSSRVWGKLFSLSDRAVYQDFFIRFTCPNHRSLLLLMMLSSVGWTVNFSTFSLLLHCILGNCDYENAAKKYMCACIHIASPPFLPCSTCVNAYASIHLFLSLHFPSPCVFCL